MKKLLLSSVAIIAFLCWEVARAAAPSASSAICNPPGKVLPITLCTICEPGPDCANSLNVQNEQCRKADLAYQHADAATQKNNRIAFFDDIYPDESSTSHTWIYTGDNTKVMSAQIMGPESDPANYSAYTNMGARPNDSDDSIVEVFGRSKSGAPNVKLDICYTNKPTGK